MAHHRSNIPYQEQNDLLESELSAKTNRLKQIAIKIGDEARYQNDLLKKIDSDFDKNQGFLGSTFSKVKKLSAQGYGGMWCTLFMFICAFFFVLYLVLRF